MLQQGDDPLIGLRSIGVSNFLASQMKSAGKRRSNSEVFISGAPRVDLDERRALALAELLQVLSCGEESATASFQDLACSCDQPAARSVLLQIAADERRHQFLLAALSAGLPGPPVDPAFKAKMRRLFMRLADRDLQVHFVRIAALDSAACQLLALLRARTGPLLVP